MKLKLSFIITIIFLAIMACKEDTSNKSTVMAESLTGTWRVIEATRNNRPALSLENSEFYISDSLFSTNFLPDTTAYKYSFDGKKISLVDKEKSIFHVSRKSLDTLTFKTEIKNFDFKFIAVKKTQEDA